MKTPVILRMWPGAALADIWFLLISIPSIALIPLASGCSSRQTTFASPDDAAKALVAAVRSDDPARLESILGHGADEIIVSGDAVADQRARATFLEAYAERNALVTEEDGSVTLLVGANDWPMPIPIAKRFNAWRFDTERGKDEILNRRIGRNELSTVQTCLAIVDAQHEYFTKDVDGDGVREYAPKLVSDPGQTNGLYWPTKDGEPPSPLGPLVATARAEGYTAGTADREQPQPYHGYRFRLLTSQGPNAAGGRRDYVVNGNLTGGFAVLAWPAEYGNSGVMTFTVDRNGIVFERDLGPRTDRVTDSMTEYDPSPAWRLVEPAP